MFDTLLRDVKHALRMFVQSPAFALAAVAALTLGIAVNTAIFSVVNAVLLRPMPFPEPDRIVFFMNVAPSGSGPGGVAGQVRALRAADGGGRTASRPSTAASSTTPTAASRNSCAAGACRRTSSGCSARRPIQGRTFTPEEDLPRGDKVVILSKASGKTRFKSDPAIVGKAMSLGGDPYTVIGVLGDFDFRDFGQRAAAGVGAVPARSELRRPGPLLSDARAA